ncbi:beta-N-acetylhexosaminidase [Niabella drilacis]|uniref:beta-N-acetylhexosaminidase n=1 Tax=Niabella drilacis (strain DSM 25811 / CCM 8410 / CCUG 62505 / LMG 26954 / E90) TaxID=1285928 RepID=A0A1G6UNM4_NIADE|nr:family 20 glycosylhydrolase [Niabella drilacis]SDD42326.1 hexosaminidase [Niabella drilacis]
MNKRILTVFALAFSLLGSAQQKNAVVALIPEPVSVIEKPGSFALPQNVTISLPAKADLGHTYALLKDRISNTGATVQEQKENTSATINLVLNKRADSRLGDEGYTLSVTTGGVTVTANKPAGLFYGAQTFLQLLPPQIESVERVDGLRLQAPAVEIVDYPRVGWRGLMLDVSRHFFTVDEVKQYIDNMSRFKYNMFHFHLTDDEGWRLQIKSLPRLTEIGAWRVNKVGLFNTFSAPLPDEPKSYGGYYTHEDIKALVQYARDRFIDIVPEIDVPGHSLAAIASYPELSCTEGADKYQVRAGEPIMDWSHGAPPIAMVDNTLCPANEKVYGFMDKVITEVAQLFPFPYIHVGGDEAPHNFWEKNPQVQALMKREKLKTIPQVQAYFEKRLEKIVNSKGKKMMGWDEILEGGISPTAALMSWRGEQYGIEASKSKHYVVMSPTQFAYIDYMQGDVSTEVPIYASLRLSQAYKFNPIPEGANAKYILGGQANLWTENVYNARQAEYMTWPRGLAIAESVWSPQEKKDWKKFAVKTEQFFDRFNAAEIKYSPAIYDPSVTVSKKDQAYFVTLTPEIDGLDIYTSFDNSAPDRFYPKYKEPLEIPKDADELRIITYKGKKEVGRQMTIKVADLKKRVKK